MRYLSVCSGIEAATVAWEPLGWSAYGFSEIEKFPSSLLQHYYPHVPNYGDMNDFRHWPETDIDVLVGGTPCQSFSVAGLRQGMADPRGNLALVYLAIAESRRPDWLVWENVPGVLSSDGGRDFGSIIGGMVELGYGVAWRVLDAQYFGVPQRRRRVFVVGYLGDWRRAGEVLFEPESLRRNPPPSRKARQEFTRDVAHSLTSGGNVKFREDQDTLIPQVANCLETTCHDYSRADGFNMIAHSLRASHDASEDGTGRGTPIVVHGSQDPCVSDKAFAIGRNLGQENAIAFAQNQRDEVRLMDKAGALAAEPGAKQQTYVFKAGQGSKAGSIAGDNHIAPTLGAADSGSNRTPSLMHGMAVRRLTPLECERLQGFPDGYTDIPGASDSARYRALGNSMAVPVMRWIGKRIAASDQTGQTE